MVKIRGRFRLLTLFAAVALGGVCPALAAVVIESEADGTATNNTLATAQALSSADFTTPIPPTVFPGVGNLTATIQGRGGDFDVDFYSFTVGKTHNRVFLDIDDDPFTFDTMLSLFDSSGTLIGFDDDSFPLDPGSEFELDSFLGTIRLAPGTYYIAVSEFANVPSTLEFVTSFSLLTRPDGQFGGFQIFDATPGESSFGVSDVQAGSPYTLHISQTVPEPGSLTLIGLGLAGTGVFFRRRTVRRS